MEAKFITNMEGAWINDDHFELTKSLIYDSPVLEKQVVVPAGFVTDFASVPRVPIAYMLFGDKAHHESVIHDWLYKIGTVPRKTADAVFLEAMEARKKSWLIRKSMWLGVRLGGWKAWGDHRKKESSK